MHTTKKSFRETCLTVFILGLVVISKKIFIVLCFCDKQKIEKSRVTSIVPGVPNSL